MNNEKIASVPKIKVTPGGKWYVYFSVRNPLTGRMRPCKIEHGFIQCKNDRERRANGEKLIAEYTAKLRNGWVPWRDPAAIYEDEINYESENRAYGKARSATRTVRKLLSEYLSFKKMSVKQKSFKTYQSKLRKFSAWLEENHYAGHDITVIDNRIVVEFFTYLIEVRGLDQCSIKNYRITLSGFFNYLRRNKRVRYSPVENIPTGLKMKDEAPRPVMPEDLDLLLNHVRARDGQLYLACLMQFFCAIRPGTEMRLLKVKDINFFMRTITVTSVNAKTTRKRCVNVPAQFFELMTKGYGLNKQDKEAYVFGREGRPGDVPMGVNSFRCRFNRFRDELGLSKDYKFYSMKHTGACFLLEKGNVTMKDLQLHLGHADMNSTSRYVANLGWNLAEKIRDNFPDPFDGFSGSV